MRKLIVIGGSVGGIQSLCAILKELPADLDAAVMVVIHTSEQSQFLPKVISNCSSLTVAAFEKAEPIVARKIYVAAPNHHLIVKSHCAVSCMGPRENRHRPSVDTLFRTAARDFRSSVIAVVLSGGQNDGSAGAIAVKTHGGTVVVQDPSDAFAEDMPANALRAVQADFCLPAKDIPAQLIKLVSAGQPVKARKISGKECAALSVEDGFETEPPPGFTCPECGGVLRKTEDGKAMQFRCHVGHAFSPESFSEAHADALERTLWEALRKLNEQNAAAETFARNHFVSPDRKKRHEENAAAAKNDMRLLHEILARL